MRGAGKWGAGGWRLGFLRVWASSHTGSVGRRAGSSSARPHGEGARHGELGPFPRRPPVPPAWLRGGGSGTNPPWAAQTGLCARGCPGPLGAVLCSAACSLEQWPEAGRRQRVSSEPAPRGAGTERPCPACWALPPGGGSELSTASASWHQGCSHGPTCTLLGPGFSPRCADGLGLGHSSPSSPGA